MKGNQGIGPSGVISGGGGGTGGGGGGKTGNPDDPTRKAPKAAGPGGICVCSSCGFEEVRVISKPCNERECPKCGARMMEVPEAPGARV